MRRISLLVLVAFFLGCSHGAAVDSAPARPTTLVILHTNDSHGHVWGTKETGSAAQRGQLIKTIRGEVEAAGGVVVTLDGGDVRTGSYCSDSKRAEPDLEAMEAMGYDAMVAGNHEFDVPYSKLLEQRALVPFPILGANVIDVARGEPLLAPVATIERGGLKVGVVGLVTESAATTSTSGSDPALRFEDPVEVARRLIPPLRQQVDVVVVLSHLGIDRDRQLAREVGGIDVIIGGHSHLAISPPAREGRTIIAAAGCDGGALGRLDLVVGPQGVELAGSRLIPVTPDTPADPAVAAVLARYACDEAQEVVAELAEPVTRDPLGAPGASSALANLVADAMRALGGTDLALINRGGLRADLPAGRVTLADVHASLPFENTLVVLEATGAQLLEVARSVASRGRDGNGVLSCSGAELVLGPGDQAQVQIDGAAVDPSRTYTITLSSFLADGGDDHQALSRLRRVRELPQTPAQALIDYLRRPGGATVDRTSRSSWLP